MVRTIPKSPLFVRKTSSSTKPKRLTWEQRAPASSYCFVTSASLNTTEPPNPNGRELCRVVLRSDLRGVEEKAEDLWIGSRCPASKEIQREEHSEGARKAAEQVEDASGHDERKEEEFSFRPKNGERAIERSEDGICFHGQSPQTPKSQVRKFTARTAMPSPNTMPAKVRFPPPSPNANVRPPTTMATKAKPFAMGPVNACCKTLTAFSQGEAPPACA